MEQEKVELQAELEHVQALADERADGMGKLADLHARRMTERDVANTDRAALLTALLARMDAGPKEDV